MPWLVLFCMHLSIQHCVAHSLGYLCPVCMSARWFVCHSSLKTVSVKDTVRLFSFVCLNGHPTHTHRDQFQICTVTSGYKSVRRMAAGLTQAFGRRFNRSSVFLPFFAYHHCPHADLVLYTSSPQIIPIFIMVCVIFFPCFSQEAKGKT